MLSVSINNNNRVFVKIPYNLFCNPSACGFALGLHLCEAAQGCQTLHFPLENTGKKKHNLLFFSSSLGQCRLFNYYTCCDMPLTASFNKQPYRVTHVLLGWTGWGRGGTLRSFASLEVMGKKRKEKSYHKYIFLLPLLSTSQVSRGEHGAAKG